jgi:DNA modification methylase
MQIESVPIASLVPDPSNARKHSKKNLDAIKGSLAKFGQQKPIVVGKNNIVLAGNGTLEAAKALGWDKINVVKTDLEGSEAVAYAIADNRTGELAEWDDDTLSKTLSALKDEGFALGSIGFDDADLSQWIKAPEIVPGCDEDEVPEHVEPKTKPGDLYQLGKHRLLCGDSTNVQHVERLMGGEKADMVFTDPPYGMNLDTDYSRMPSTKASGNKTYRPIIGDDVDFDPGVLLGYFADCEEMILFGADYYAKHLQQGSWYVWDKRVTENFDAMIGSSFELAWSKKRHKREIARFNNTLFSGEAEARNKVHPTQKPTKLIEWFFDRIQGHLVVDPFLGSGSTLIACEKTNRRCFGMEIDPHYVDIIVARWEKFTGQKATLLSEA